MTMYETSDGSAFDDPNIALELEKNRMEILQNAWDGARLNIERIAEQVEIIREHKNVSGEGVFRKLYPLLWEYMPDGWGEPDWMREARGE